jgi:ribosome-associated protein
MPKKAAVKTAYPPLVHAILDGLSDLKAENATVIDLRELENAVAAFFIIADAQSNTQVNAMGQAVRKQAREQCAERPWHVEGEDNSEWILLDYVSTVVHLFQDPSQDPSGEKRACREKRARGEEIAGGECCSNRHQGQSRGQTQSSPQNQDTGRRKIGPQKINLPSPTRRSSTPNPWRKN